MCIIFLKKSSHSPYIYTTGGAAYFASDHGSPLCAVPWLMGRGVHSHSTVRPGSAPTDGNRFAMRHLLSPLTRRTRVRLGPDGRSTPACAQVPLFRQGSGLPHFLGL